MPLRQQDSYCLSTLAHATVLTYENDVRVTLLGPWWLPYVVRLGRTKNTNLRQELVLNSRTV